MRPLNRLVTPLALFFLAACGDIQERGFSLPEGDLAKGKETFAALGCRACHHVDSSDPELVVTRDPASATEIDVGLGGTVGRIKTYGELVTSVINPSHRIAETHLDDRYARDGVSRMSNFNSVMRVDELVDLVTYLETAYELRVVRTRYPTYPHYF